MFCGQCGTENENGARFCKGCGAPLTQPGNEKPSNEQLKMTSTAGAEETVGKREKASFGTTAGVNAGQLADKLKTMPRKVLFGGIAVVAAIIVIIVAAVNAGKTIDLNKYVTFEASGYDGYGTVNVTIDWDGIEKKYGSKLSYTGAAQEKYSSLLSLTSPMDVMQECVDVKLDENGSFSNGDTAAYTWEVNEDFAEAINCKLKYEDGTYNVSGLTEVGTFDAFADLTVEFTGISPSGSAEISYNGSELSSYDFHCDKTSGLKNGDSITVSISDTDMEYYVQKFGMIPETTSKTYTVSGLQAYVSGYSDLTEEFLSDLKKEAEDSIYAYSVNPYTYGDYISLDNLEYAGYIFKAVKDGDDGYISFYNKLYIIYKGDVSSKNEKFDTVKVYFPVRFSNILKGEDGSLSYSDKDGIAGSSDLGGSYYSTDGYSNPFICYKEIAESDEDAYNTECGGEIEKYSSYTYVDKMDDISDEEKQTLYADAKDRIEKFVEENYIDGTSIANMEVAGDYLLTAKSQNDNAKYHSRYYVVYKATIANTEGAWSDTDVYLPVEYDELVKLTNGEYVVTKSGGISGYSDLNDSYYQTKGYVDGTEMYSEIITANRDNYTYEVSEGLKAFGE